MAKRLLAIYAECNRRIKAREAQAARIVLANCVWETSDPRVMGTYDAKYRQLEAEEHDRYRRFAETVWPAIELFADLGIDFALRYYSFSDFLDLLDLEPAHRAALAHYTIGSMPEEALDQHEQ